MAGGKREDLEIVVGADLGPLASDLARGKTLLKEFAGAVDRMAPRSKDLAPNFFDRSYSRAAAAARATAGGVKSLTMEMASFTAKAAIAGGVLLGLEGGLAGVGEVMKQLKESVRMAADVEQTAIGFETMLQSAEKAKEVMGGLRKFAAETPFSQREVTEAGRQLLAYGVAADQLVPTLKVLGTLSAVNPDVVPLKRMAYLWGTLKVQQRAYAIDIRQFTEAGVDVLPGLAKRMGVTVGELHKLTEEGRIDANDLGAALTELANTRYAGLLEKQADSLRGRWEQMTDALDLAKIKLGGLIIEETGLKDSLRDLEDFGKRLENTIDTPKLRQGIRFVADLAKGGAQVAYEFARAGLAISDIAFDSIGRAFPGVQRWADSVKSIVNDMKSFKVDDEKLADQALTLMENVVIGIAKTIDWSERLGESLRKDLLEPLDNAVKRMGQMHALANPVTAMTAWNVAILKSIGVLPEDKPAPKQIPKPEDIVLPKGDKDVLAEWGRRNKEFRQSFEVWQKPGSGAAEREVFREKERQLAGFLRLFKGDPKDTALALEKGMVPERLAVTPKAKSREDIAREAMAVLRDEVITRVRKSKAGQLLDDLRPFNDSMRDLAAAQAMGPMNTLGPALRLAGNSAEGRIRPDDRPPQHLVDIAKKIKDEFDPLPELMKQKLDLEKAMGLGLLNHQEYDFGYRKAVEGVADKLGIRGETKLPDAALVGSQEDARILANFAAGNQQKTTEDLLRQIGEYLRQIRDSNGDMARNNPAVADFGGGGDF